MGGNKKKWRKLQVCRAVFSYSQINDGGYLKFELFFFTVVYISFSCLFSDFEI